MMHKIKIEPIEEPVTLDDMRRQIGISDPSDTMRDDIIEKRIVSARRWAEQFSERAFVTQTWEYYGYCFKNSIRLRKDVQSVISVKYLDNDGARQTLDSSFYDVDTVGSFIRLAWGKEWPAHRAAENSIIIEYVCGYGLAVSVPEDIKDAIKFIVGQWENYQSGIESGGRVSTVPYAAEQLLRPYRDARGAF